MFINKKGDRGVIDCSNRFEGLTVSGGSSKEIETVNPPTLCKRKVRKNKLRQMKHKNKSRKGLILSRWQEQLLKKQRRPKLTINIDSPNDVSVSKLKRLKRKYSRIARENAWHRDHMESDATIEERELQQIRSRQDVFKILGRARISTESIKEISEYLEGPYDSDDHEFNSHLIDSIIENECETRRSKNKARAERRTKARLRSYFQDGNDEIEIPDHPNMKARKEKEDNMDVEPIQKDFSRYDIDMEVIQNKLDNITVQADVTDEDADAGLRPTGFHIIAAQIFKKLAFTDYGVKHFNEHGKRLIDETSLLYHIEHLFETLILIKNSATWQMALLQIKVYLGTVFRLSTAEMFMRIVEKIDKTTEGVSTQGAYDDFKQLFADWKNIYKGEFIQKVIKIICCIASMGFCTISSIPFCSEKFEKFYKKSELKDKVWPDLVTCIIDSVIFIFDRCVTWFKGDCAFMDIIRSPSAAYTYDKELAFLLANIGLYEDNTLDKVNIERHEYEKRLEDLTVLTKNFYEKSSGPERRVMGLNMKEIEKLKYKVITASLAMPMREAPFSWALYGLTSVGKTALSNILVNALMRINGMNPDPKYIVHINAADKYQSELQSWHTVVSVDDLANTKAEHEEGSSTQLVLDYVNNDPKHALKADVDSKGRVLIKPKLFCVTTNVKRVEAHVKSNEPLSILRRLNIMITVVVKPEFRKPGSHFLDPAKMTEKINDAWTFTVEEAVPLEGVGEGSPFTFKPLVWNGKQLINVSLNTLVKYLGERSKTHFEQQKKLLENVKDVHEQELCEHGSYINICDECKAIMDEPFLHTQASVRDFVSYNYMKNLNGLWYNLYERCPHRLLYNSRFGRIYDLYIGSDNIKTSQKKFNAYIVLLLLLCAYVGYNVGFKYSTISIICVIIYTHCLVYYTINTMRVASDNLHKSTISHIQPFIQHKYTILAGLTLPFLVAAFLKKMKPVIQVSMNNISSQGNMHVTPTPDANYKPNEWLKPEVVAPPRTIQVSTTTLDQLTQILKGELAHATFSRDIDTRTLSCNAFPLKGNVWIVNYHAVVLGFNYIDIVRRTGGITNNRKCRYHEGSWKRIPNTDLVLISLPSAGENKDLVPYFPTVDKFFCEPVVWLHKDKEANITEDKFVAEFKQVEFIDKITKEFHTYKGWHYTLSQKSSDGMCMAPIISRGKFPWILGFHSAGDSSTNFGIGHYVTRGELSDTYDQLFTREIGCSNNINVQVHSSGNMNLDFPLFNIKHTGKLHYKSPFNFFTTPGCASLYGAHTGMRRRFKSEVVPTYISDSVTKHLGIAPKHGPPKNIGNWRPWHADALLVTQTVDLDMDILALAYADLEDHIYKVLNKMDLVSMISPMSRVATLSGVDGCRGIDAIKLSTSAGFPRCKPKRNYVFETEEEYENITRPLDANPEIWEEVERCQKELSEGRRVYFIHRINLKDEPTKLDKEKVRTFAGCTIECLLMIRMYFLPIAKLMMDNSELFECAVGVNAHGPDWTRLTRHMQKFGEDRMVAGDYKSYDSLMWCFIVLLAFMLMIDIGVKSGYSDEDIAIMRGLATELAYGIAEYNGEYVGFYSQNYSGHGLTVFINNIGNSLYMRFAFYDIKDAINKNKKEWIQGFKEHLKKENGETFDFDAFMQKYMFKSGATGMFSDHISLMCYGDDNKMSVSRDIQFFNHCSISYSLARNGITYTMADKMSLSVPFIRACDCSFLKRNSVWSERYQQYLAPLELDSMVKTLHAAVASKVITPQQQSAEALDSVIRELWYHGEIVFNEWRDKLQLVLIECDLQGFFKTGALHTFDFLESEYISKYLCDSDIKNSCAATPIAEIAKTGPMILDTQCRLSQEVTNQHKALSSAGIVSYSGQSSPAHQSPPHLGHNSKPNVVSVWIATNNTDTVNVTSTMMGPQDHQTVTFRDGTPQWESKIEGAYEETRNVGMDNSVPLSQFFSRPIKHTIADWVPGSATPYSEIFDPWSIFFENPRVSNRISNFNLLQATLRVKFMINGNAFYYGRLMVDYAPLAMFRTADSFNTLARGNIVTASQRSHIFINPTTSQAGEIHCPFITPRNALSIPEGQWQEMGMIHVREINPLKHANASTQPASISCYIWAEDVKLSVPTTRNAANISTQGKDEYGSRPISNLASNIAKYTGQLEKWPVIGPYAKATSMISSTVGAVAKIFGFSRPAIIADTMQMRPEIVGKMAVTDIGDSCTKLTVDSKQELSIDPRIVGADTHDELDIKCIASKESYLTTFQWLTTNVTDNLLWNAKVSPMVTVNDNTTSPSRVQMPACAFAALPFQYWRGTMRYRFQIVCSDFHRGRLRFVYDPVRVDSTESNIGFNKIVDLCDDRDFTMDVSWAQTQSYLPVPNFAISGTAASYGTTTGLSTNPLFWNGVIGVYVLNELTTPNSVTNNDIQINVYVSMCDDAEFQAPNNAIKELAINTQGEDSADHEQDNAPVQTESDEGILSCNIVDHTNDVYFGESIVSFRQLLKRYNYYQSLLSPTSTRAQWYFSKSDFPFYRGPFSYGINTDSVDTYNDVNNTMINYISGAFLCKRGGIRWKYIFNSDESDPINFARVERNPVAFSTVFSNDSAAVIETNPSIFAEYMRQFTNAGYTGTHITYLKEQPSLEFECPNYSEYRFGIPKSIVTPSTDGFSVFRNNHTVSTIQSATANSPWVDQYVAAAEDFSLSVFQGCPPLYVFAVSSPV